METLSNPRFERGLALVRQSGARRLRRALWSVNSASHGGQYLVDLTAEVPACTCPDHEAHGGDRDFRCKHTFAALIAANKIEIPAGMTETSKRQTYRQHWPSYERAQEHERERFEVLLRNLCGGIINPVHTRGRPRAPLADIVFYAVLRAYMDMSTRRVASDVRAAQSAGLIDMAVSPKTLNRYLKDPSLAPLLRSLIRESATPLAQVEDRFAVDASGFSTCTYARWFDHKWGRERSKREWVKAHICVGVNTHIVTDVIVTGMGEGSGDAPHLPELVANTAERFGVSEVSADGAYSSFRNFDAIEAVGAVPYVPFKTGTTGEGPAMWRRMWALFMFDNERFRRHYHARSNVETTFAMVKKKFGASVRGKIFAAQRNEVLCKILAHNLCVLVASHFELGIESAFWGASPEGGHDVH